MVGRYWKATLFNEKNVNCQCRACNTAHESNPAPYRIAFIAKWGKHKYHELYAESKRMVRRTTQDYLDIAAEYKERLEAFDL